MWLNYLKKDVTNYEIRTTLVAESIHSSMKCHFDGARANFGLQKSAETMLDKVKRKHIETKRSNAKNIDSNRVISSNEYDKYLTDYAFLKVQKEFSLFQKCKVL